MRVSSAHAAAFTLLILLLPLVVVGRQIARSRRDGWHHGATAPAVVGRGGNARAGLYVEVMEKKGKADTVQVAGSSLPDCSHACGSCSPCRLVMVSFVCASLQEAETCPMAYKCMCNRKSYPVP
ncbi:protein EPIDERMAL PATTERNING FACTOR 1 [Phoenix dactylifera]|uniref:Epidermal patterning factor-like protein n=1 Tax=Phoenix dactylifera TaxID=42345 RepID=A0A8B7CHD5_PHODC|nr:protein EPIDERMAL PATTERNING FACTOR 1 [Phoenix dactylifera]